MTPCAIASRVSEAISRPLAIVLFPAICVVWLALGLSVDVLTMVLSVLAITITQLVLLDAARFTTAEHVKLDALLKGTDADETVVGAEKI